MFGVIKERIRFAASNASLLIWTVNIKHYLWGWFFLTQELPLPFGTIHTYSNFELQTFWGISFIVVATLAIISDFSNNIKAILLLLIPQQIIVTYGLTDMISAIIQEPSNSSRILLALCLTGPIAVLYTVAIIRRFQLLYTNMLIHRFRLTFWHR